MVKKPPTSPAPNFRPGALQLRDIAERIERQANEAGEQPPGRLAQHVWAQHAARNPAAPLTEPRSAAYIQAQRLDNLRAEMVNNNANENEFRVNCTFVFDIRDFSRALGLPDAAVLRRLFDQQLSQAVNNEAKENMDDTDHA